MILVGIGQLHYETTLKVIDPETKMECLPGHVRFYLDILRVQVGEFWISNPCVAKGYWRQEELTKDTFQAYTARKEGPFLRTGDLGFVLDGEYFFTSRLKVRRTVQIYKKSSLNG